MPRNSGAFLPEEEGNTMFTVKTIINGVTHICEQPSVTIARAGCERFDDILLQTNDHSNPDFAIWLPAVYSDPQCKDALQEEELIVSERDGVLDEDAIAILVKTSKALCMQSARHSTAFATSSSTPATRYM
jgi:hypothetical protein